MLTATLTLLVALLLPQAAPIDVGANSGGKFAFDWNGQHADGTPDATTTKVEFHYMPVPPVTPVGGGDGHISVEIDLAAKTGENVIPMKTALLGVPEGIYDLDVRFIGAGGNPSSYSTPVLAIRVRVKNPDAPTNVRVVGN